MITSVKDVVKLPHHDKQEVCTSRARYRQGRKFTAVKVYTINDESQHLVISGVPALGLQDELKKLCSRYGEVKSLVFIPNYEQEEFAEAYHVLYNKIQSARFAKHHLDDKSYFGGTLHVCYAPEMESVIETREKLIQRRKDVAKRTRGLPSAVQNSKVTKQYHRRKKHPALPLTAERLSTVTQDAECIWNGIPQDIDPRLRGSVQEKSEIVYGPQKPDKKWIEAGVLEQKIIPRKKYSSPVNQIASSFQKEIGGVDIPKNQTCISSQLLRFIPTQVKNARRIIFHKNIQAKPDIEKEIDHMHGDFANNPSVEETILSVRKKIKAVSVPSIQVILEKK